MNIYYRKTGLLIAFFSCITIHNAYCSEKKSFIERAKPYYERAKPYYNSTKNWASQKKDTIVDTVKNNPRTTAGIVLGVGALTIAYKARKRMKQWIEKLKNIKWRSKGEDWS